jgi:MFS transporter, SP family, general alpha glucoside:H+ symporter
MTVTISMGYSLGGFIVSLVLNSTGTLSSRWAYRAVFVSQYGVAGISAILLFFAPE